MKRAREHTKKIQIQIKINQTHFRDLLPGLSVTWFLSPASSQRVHHCIVMTLEIFQISFIIDSDRPSLWRCFDKYFPIH